MGLWGAAAGVFDAFLPHFRMYTTYCGNYHQGLAALGRLRQRDWSLGSALDEVGRVCVLLVCCSCVCVCVCGFVCVRV